MLFCARVQCPRSRQTGWGKSRSAVVCERAYSCILFINYCILFHANCKPTSIHPELHLNLECHEGFIRHLQRKATGDHGAPEQRMPSMLRHPPELPVLAEVGQHVSLPLTSPCCQKCWGACAPPWPKLSVQAPPVAGL